MSAVPEIKQPIVSIVSESQLTHFSLPEIRVNAGTRRHGFATLWNRFALWCEKRNGRRALREFTDEQLADIGISRAEADKEVSKSYFWD
jgi:uncharacterized protein YjiS (DUF1127 family)